MYLHKLIPRDLDKIEYLGEVLGKLNEKLCYGEQCYIGTCPVNTISKVINKHINEGPLFLLFGDYLLLKTRLQ